MSVESRLDALEGLTESSQEALIEIAVFIGEDLDRRIFCDPRRRRVVRVEQAATGGTE
jgi:hypothetical protein